MKRRRNIASGIGVFDLGDGHPLTGELTEAGSKTRLSLHSKEFFHPRTDPADYILGSLNDLTKVSLIDCVSFGTGSMGGGDERSYFANVFPHFVVRGTQHLIPDEKVILEAHFVIDDATTLFYDFDAFGSVINARPLIEQIVSANGLDREIPLGEHPQIQYFTGKSQIFCTDTPIGKVSCYHSPSWSMGGPEGVQIKNKIRTLVQFADGVQFQHAIDQIYTLRNYFSILVGRSQKVSDVRLLLKSELDRPVILDVLWSLAPTRKKSMSERRPHPADILIDAVRSPDAFCRVLVKWLDRQPPWRDARHRFNGVFAEQRNYDVDRLIGSANMFDILPPAAVPTDVELSPELQKAKTDAQHIFKGLAASPERDSVLGALGRLGKSSLKRKVRFRAQMLLEALPNRFPHLISVVDQAVDCRNYFVHGGEPRMNYSENSDIIWFFVDTLEFIFGASDLIEAGWNIQEWNARTSVSHPFGRYIRNYSAQIARLNIV